MKDPSTSEIWKEVLKGWIKKSEERIRDYLRDVIHIETKIECEEAAIKISKKTSEP